MRMMMPVPGDRAATSETRDDFGASPLRAQRRARRAWSPRVATERERLTVSEPGDASEREADAVAQRLVRGEPAFVSPLARRAQRQSAAVAAVETTASATVPPGGAPLPAGARSSFEQLLGIDLQAVRLHTDDEAARYADRLSADAYTIGDDMVFAAGRWAPHTPAGRELLAHELAHVAQQRGGERVVHRHGRTPSTSEPSTAPRPWHGATPSVRRGLHVLARTQLAALDAALQSDPSLPARLTAASRARPGTSVLDLVGEVWFATHRHLMRLDRRGRLEEGDWLYEVSASSLAPGGTYVFAEIQLTGGSRSTARHLVRVDGVQGLSEHDVGTRRVLGTLLPLAQHGDAALAGGRLLAVIAPEGESALESPVFSPQRVGSALRRAVRRVPDAARQTWRRIRGDAAGFAEEQLVGFAQGALLELCPPAGSAVMAVQVLHDVLPMLELAGNAVSPADEVELAAQGIARYVVETAVGVLGGMAVAHGVRAGSRLRERMLERRRAARAEAPAAEGDAEHAAPQETPAPGEAPASGEAPPRPARPELLAALGELASHFDVSENPNLRGDAARVVYDVPGGRPRLEVGPATSAFMVGRHRGVMHVVLRFRARYGQARRALSRLGELLGLGPGFGAEGWEARLEVAKLTQILALLEPVYAQLAAQEAGMAPGRARPEVSEALMRQIVELRQQLGEHELRVDSHARGRGYVAAGRSERRQNQLEQALREMQQQEEMRRQYEEERGLEERPRGDVEHGTESRPVALSPEDARRLTPLEHNIQRELQATRLERLRQELRRALERQGSASDPAEVSRAEQQVEQARRALDEEIRFLVKYPSEAQRGLYRGRSEHDIVEMQRWLERWTRSTYRDEESSAFYHGERHGVPQTFGNYMEYLRAANEAFEHFQAGRLRRLHASNDATYYADNEGNRLAVRGRGNEARIVWFGRSDDGSE